MKVLSKAIAKHEEDALAAANESLKQFDAEAIHRLRVSLKQLRAVFNILLFSGQGVIGEEDWKAARKIFKQAGRVREKQLLRERILALTRAGQVPKKTVLAFLEKKEHSAQRKFKQHFTDCGKRDVKKLQKKMQKAAEEITTENLKAYFDDLLQRINHLRAMQNISEAQLHQLRKYLKELKYNRSFAEEEPGVLMDGVLESEKLNAWEELIGKWHDEVVFVQRGEKLKEQMKADGELREVIAEMEEVSSKNSEQLLHELTERFPPGGDGATAD